MQRPAIKPLYRIYRREGENAVFIGQGPDKFAVEDPTPEMQEFLVALDGSLTAGQLRERFPQADAWLRDLDEAGLLEDAAAPPPIDAAIATRWSRQINYLRLFERPGWSGWQAQRRLSESRVVVVGTGAGGSTLLRLLNAAGVGTLEAVDFDTVALDNLATHATLYEEDAGSHKLEAMRRHLHRQNSQCTFVPHRRRAESAETLAELVDGADFFCIAFDRPLLEAARWSNRAGLQTGVPFGSIGVTDRGARAGPIVLPGRTSCFECVGIRDIEFLRMERPGGALNGATVAMLAGILVGEIIKVLTGSAPSGLLGRSLYVDTGTLEFTFTDHPQNPDCACARVEAPVAGTARV